VVQTRIHSRLSLHRSSSVHAAPDSFVSGY
jgi:hypothetical protein